MNNVIVEELGQQQEQVLAPPVQAPAPAPAAPVPQQRYPPQSAAVQQFSSNALLEADIVDENTALNLLVSFLTLANRRGIFSLEEAHKIWECVRKFR
jgi:hypothetical protein